MCRMVIYKGYPLLMADLITRPEHSVINQSYDCRERKEATASLPARLNADGFGVGWYAPQANQVDPTPCVFTSTLPAWNNRNLFRLCSKITSPLIFAHVRAAGAGGAITEINCHPFAVGRYMWMHNGHIAEFGRLKRRLIASLEDDVFQSIAGTTDSEHAFAVFLHELGRPFDEDAEPMELQQAMVRTIHRIRQLRISCGVTSHSYLNFAVTNGETVVISRVIDDDNHRLKAASMYFSCGTAFEEICDGHFKMRHTNRREELVIIASERLTSVEEDWVEVPQNHIVVITPILNVFLMKVDLPPAVFASK